MGAYKNNKAQKEWGVGGRQAPQVTLYFKLKNRVKEVTYDGEGIVSIGERGQGGPEEGVSGRKLFIF